MSKLVVIVGPTASGKSALGLKLAQEFNGEIINADSKAVYRYMDIGTAKPTPDELLLIPHHLVNIKNPGEPYSASEFKQAAEAAIKDISNRGKLPIMVGGTGLYIDSVLYDYQFPQETMGMRDQLASLSLEQLQRRLAEVDADVMADIDMKNPRRVMRAIELAGQPKSKSESMRSGTLVIGLVLSKEIIQNRLQQRLEKMLGEGLIDEVRRVGEQFGWNSESMTGLAYRVFKDVVLGAKTLDEAKAEFTKQEMGLVKRQLTWFKRNRDIHWLETEDPERLVGEAHELVRQILFERSEN